jgi:hypothetical protein
LLLKELSVSSNDGASTVPIAPPHAEHAVIVVAAFGQVAVLFSNVLELTTSKPDVNPTAPPIWAVLLKNKQLLMVRLLPLAETAPPTPFKTSKLT